MSDKDAENAGCLIMVGLAIVSCAVGTICGQPYGWLTFGAALLVLGVIAMAGK